MKFTDKLDREWDCDITMATVKRVRSGADVNLLEALEGDLVYKLGTDLELLAQVLWCVVEPQAAEKDVSPESFAEGLAGDHFASAADAFMDGLRGFFTRQDQRELISNVIGKTKEALGTAYQIGNETLESIDASKIVREEAEKLSQQQQQSG